jgi:hypothetical protein
MAKKLDTSALSAKDQKALAELLAKAGTKIEALSIGGNGKAPSPMSDPEYVKKCIEVVRPELDAICAKHGVKLSHVFTADKGPRKVYRHPETGETYESKGKPPAWYSAASKEQRKEWLAS